jgi:hypothetical protein
MRAILSALVGLIAGCTAGWLMRGMSESEPALMENYNFNDRLSDSGFSYLSARGTWRGAPLANKHNVARLVCDAVNRTCEIDQADLMMLDRRSYLSLHRRTFKSQSWTLQC